MMVWFSKSSVMCAVLSGVMMWPVDVPLAWVVGIGVPLRSVCQGSISA